MHPKQIVPKIITTTSTIQLHNWHSINLFSNGNLWSWHETSSKLWHRPPAYAKSDSQFYWRIRLKSTAYFFDPPCTSSATRRLRCVRQQLSSSSSSSSGSGLEGQPASDARCKRARTPATFRSRRREAPGLYRIGLDVGQAPALLAPWRRPPANTGTINLPRVVWLLTFSRDISLLHARSRRKERVSCFVKQFPLRSAGFYSSCVRAAG